MGRAALRKGDKEILRRPEDAIREEGSWLARWSARLAQPQPDPELTVSGSWDFPGASPASPFCFCVWEGGDKMQNCVYSEKGHSVLITLALLLPLVHAAGKIFSQTTPTRAG